MNTTTAPKTKAQPALDKARWYQLQAVEDTIQALNDGNRRVLVVSPTGSGKTMIAAMLSSHPQLRAQLGAEGRPLRILYIAHSNRLLKQAADMYTSIGADVTGVV